MRPYQINPPHGPWLDLDHVLILYPLDDETEFDRRVGTRIEIVVRTAFLSEGVAFPLGRSNPNIGASGRSLGWEQSKREYDRLFEEWTRNAHTSPPLRPKDYTEGA